MQSPAPRGKKAGARFRSEAKTSVGYAARRGPFSSVRKDWSLRLALSLAHQKCLQIVSNARAGTIAPRRFADLVGYRTDPVTCPIDVVPSLHPTCTMVKDQAVFDPDDMFVH